MADYFTKVSVAFSLPKEAAIAVVDYIDLLEACAHGTAEDDDIAEAIAKGWPEPSDVMTRFDDHVGLTASIETGNLLAREGEVPVWIRDDASTANIDLLVFVLERTWEKFRIPTPVGFQWTLDCSKARLDAYGGGFAVIGCDALGRPFSQVQDTKSMMEVALREIETRPQHDPRWVIRAVDALDAVDPHPVIRKHDGSWVYVTPETLDVDDTYMATDASLLPLPSNSAWCRVDLLEGPVVPSEIHSDDNTMQGVFDARPWLMTAEPGDILEVAHVGWSYAEELDRVALEMEAMGEPATCRVMDYIGLRPTMPDGDAVGFGCSIDADHAMAWLEAHRPDVHAAIRAEMDPSDAPEV